MKKSRKAPFATPTKEERELIINRTGVDPDFDVYTSDPKWYNLLMRRGHKPYQVDAHGASFKVPRVSILSKARPSRKRPPNVVETPPDTFPA